MAPACDTRSSEAVGDATAAADATGAEAASAFHEEYRLGEEIGRGAFGRVYAVRRPGRGEDPTLAVKVVDLLSAPGARQAVEAEAAALAAVQSSDHVVRFQDLFLDGGVAHLVMERCDTSLVRFLEGVPRLVEEDLRSLFRGMLAGVAACHAAGIVHRDVKPDNFLVAEGAAPRGARVKLCDLGLSSRLSRPGARELEGSFGTAPYMAPEMLLGDAYGAKVDVWSFGATAHVLLLGRWPYSAPDSSRSAMKAAIVSGVPEPDFSSRLGLPEVSSTCTAWLRCLLRRSADARPCAKGALLHRALHASWATGVSLRPALEEAARIGAFTSEAKSSNPCCAYFPVKVAEQRRHNTAGDPSAARPVLLRRVARRAGAAARLLEPMQQRRTGCRGCSVTVAPRDAL